MSAEPNFRRPTSAPSARSRRDLVEWARLTEQGVERTRVSAQVWRNGLAGFVTLLLSALVLKGSDLAGTPQPYRSIAVLGCLTGTAFAIAGLWQALQAEAPTESKVSFESVIQKYGSLSSYQQHRVAAGQRRLANARNLVFCALVLLTSGIAAWWLAPAPEQSAGSISVRWSSGGLEHSACGKLMPAGKREVVVQPNAGTDPVTIRSSQIVTLVQVGVCE